MFARAATVSVALYSCWVAAPSVGADLKHPDGRRLVAEGSCDGDIDLYLVDTDARTVRRLRHSPLTEGYPRWFYDGQRVAFHRIDDTGISRIVVAHVSDAGTIDNQIVVTSGPFDIEPAPSPDGRRVAYHSVTAEDSTSIRIIDLQGPGTVELTCADARRRPTDE